MASISTSISGFFKRFTTTDDRAGSGSRKWLAYSSVIAADDSDSATYDFFAVSVVPSVPMPEAKQFADSISILSDKNDKVKGFDISKYIDASYIQKAVSLGLDKP